jgi:hypothetical protein
MAVALTLALTGPAAAGPITLAPGDTATFTAFPLTTMSLSLPAGFFGAGAPAFTAPALGLMDGGPGFTGALFTITGTPQSAGPNKLTVPIQMTQLGLQSINPIKVNTGSGTSTYNVFVTLDPTVSGNGKGTSLLTLTTPSLGTFSSTTLAFTPKITFVPTGGGTTLSTSLSGPALAQLGGLADNGNTGQLSGQFALHRTGLTLVLLPQGGIVDPPAAPEPTSLVLAGLGGIGLVGWRCWRRGRRAALPVAPPA